MTRTSNQLMGYARIRTRRTQELYDLDTKAELQEPVREQGKSGVPQSSSTNRA